MDANMRQAPVVVAPRVRQTVLVASARGATTTELVGALERRGLGAVVAGTAAEAVQTFREQGPAAVFLELPLPDETSKRVLSRLREIDASVVSIVSGSDQDVRVAADAFELGAYEYLEKPTPEALLSTIGEAIGSRRGDVHLRYLRQRHAPAADWSTFVGQSPALRSVVGILQQVCRRTSSGGAPTILLNGETGTGKGFVAKCLHYNTSRRNRTFVEVNCAALPPSLIEAELFGHERGAFTDAKAARAGLFEAADGGTLFLDEIAAIPIDLQAKLLTAIEEKKIRRIGSRHAIQVDVQIITATHEDLAERAAEGTFRADLFHRLNVVAVMLPPLRERGDDAVLLAQSFITSICREYGIPPRELADDAREWIRRHAWPGNVREVRNRIERIVLLENDGVVRAAHFGVAADVRTGRSGATPASSGKMRVARPASAGTAAVSVTTENGVNVKLPPGGVPLNELERAVIHEALVACKGNVSAAARFLSISRQTLMYRIKKHALDPDATGDPQDGEELEELDGE
jgi:two-component system, NtrC family, response regulator AtoC